jgi:hypothetical protein
MVQLECAVSLFWSEKTRPGTPQKPRKHATLQKRESRILRHQDQQSSFRIRFG